MSTATARAHIVTDTPYGAVAERHVLHEKLSKKPSKTGMLIFAGVLIAG
jgi:hypothetical protein